MYELKVFSEFSDKSLADKFEDLIEYISETKMSGDIDFLRGHIETLEDPFKSATKVIIDNKKFWNIDPEVGSSIDNGNYVTDIGIFVREKDRGFENALEKWFLDIGASNFSLMYEKSIGDVNDEYISLEPANKNSKREIKEDSDIPDFFCFDGAMMIQFSPSNKNDVMDMAKYLTKEHVELHTVEKSLSDFKDRYVEIYGDSHGKLLSTVCDSSVFKPLNSLVCNDGVVTMSMKAYPIYYWFNDFINLEFFKVLKFRARSKKSLYGYQGRVAYAGDAGDSDEDIEDYIFW